MVDDDDNDDDDTHLPQIIVRVGMVFRRGQQNIHFPSDGVIFPSDGLNFLKTHIARKQFVSPPEIGVVERAKRTWIFAKVLPRECFFSSGARV